MNKNIQTMNGNLELLAPAGDLEKMKVAIAFGADAVYCGLPDFSLRARINRFDEKSLAEAVDFCRKHKKKIYFTFNIYAHNSHLEKIGRAIEFLKKVRPDGIIVSDPGIIAVLKREIPDLPLHISTQANVTNYEAARFWKQQGASRVILAREVSLREMKEIHEKVGDVELETFVHGAMCMAYSGRCILSKWMTGRSANLGDCAQPCRWQYSLSNDENDVDDQEVKVLNVTDTKERFGLELEEDNNGTYFFNSNDICLIEHIEDLVAAGISSFKIEGRAKSAYYVAVVVRAYRKVLDAAVAKMNGKISPEELAEVIEKQKAEMETLANRGYSKGFAMGVEPNHLFDIASHESKWMYVGMAKDEFEGQRNKRSVFVHNALKVGDEVEVVREKENVTAKIVSISDEDGELIDAAHGGLGKTFSVEFNLPIGDFFLLRKKVN